MTSQSWRHRFGLLVLAAAVPLTGCTPTGAVSPTAPPSSSTSVPASATDAQATVDRLGQAALTANRTAFLAEVADRDPSFADRARLLYDNLSGLPLDRLRFRLAATRQPLPATRQAVLGAAAWRQQATVSWRLTGETATAAATVWLTFVPDGEGVRLAGTLDTPAGPASPEPIWWTGPVTAVRAGDLTVLAGAGQPAGQWLTRTRAAVRDVRQRVTAGSARRWTGAAVVEVPASRAAFEAVLGATPGSYAEIAAVTLAEGPAATAAVRVVVNPEVTGRSDLAVATVLTHELVHVATRSADSPAPTWAVEGLADDMAFASHPGAAADSLRLLQDQVRRHGAPAALPADDAFDTGRPDLDLTYAEAWSVCRYVTDARSSAVLQRLYTALDDGTPLDRAAQDQLGMSATQLTAGWRRWLVRRAGG